MAPLYSEPVRRHASRISPLFTVSQAFFRSSKTYNYPTLLIENSWDGKRRSSFKVGILQSQNCWRMFIEFSSTNGCGKGMFSYAVFNHVMALDGKSVALFYSSSWTSAMIKSTNRLELTTDHVIRTNNFNMNMHCE